MADADALGRRTALLAGATGLIGRSLLAQLLADARYASVEVLARRPLPAEVAHQPRLSVLIGDEAVLTRAAPGADDVYLALGTTIKVAGSQAAFRAVDFDLVVAIARAARAAGATRLGIVSAHGADTASRVFYSRVKGEVEAAIGALGYDTVVIARPSLLLGDRGALGQPARSGEVLAARLLGPVMALVPASIRPIGATTVATAMIAALTGSGPGRHVLTSAQMQRSGRD